MNFLKQNVLITSCITLCFLLSSSYLSAQSPANNKKIVVKTINTTSENEKSINQNNHSSSSVTEKISNAKKNGFETSDLYADKVPTVKMKAVIDSLTLAEEFEEEDLMYPAEDIYQTWNTERVNPYGHSGVQIPDTFTINISTLVVPIDGDIRITSNFGPRRRRIHYGTDLKVEIGDTIRAASDGKVRVRSYERRGYGKFLVLRHSNGLETVYGHLSDYLVDTDDVVKAGQPIALGGNTGRSTGPHLHFETRFVGQAIDPTEIFDFENQVTHRDTYVFNKQKTVNKYTSTGKGKIVYHRVKKGDTLGAIARKYRVTVTQLCRLNKLSTKSTLRPGQTIRCS